MDSRIRKHTLGYWEVIDKPSQELLQKYYAEKYYQEGRGSYEMEYSEEELMYFNAKLRLRFEVIQRYISPPPPHAPFNHGQTFSLLDVGCGEGFALAFFRRHGWKVRGLDFSSAGVASKNPDCLDVLMTGDVFALLDAEINAGAMYDVVWLQNVLEHVLDPIGLLTSLRELIAPGGLAVVTVPNDCSVTQQAALENGHIESAFWVAPPDHLSYFDHVSLENVAYETGWQCLMMLGDFPIDWFLFHAGSNYVHDRSVGKAAHNARVQIENVIHARPIDDVIAYWAATATLGLGRDITAFIRPAGKG
jgi:2-polyprenyl-3-methyl-5-hydroxy-6-metoxy-1,4-benzoquinol methylase